MSLRFVNLHATRASVHAGDDGDAPHARRFEGPFGSLEAAIDHVAASGYLPSISGGEATWSVTSGIPLAVVAQQWDAPRMLFLTGADLAALDRAGETLRLRFNYHAQQDPEIVRNVLRELKLRA